MQATYRCPICNGAGSDLLELRDQPIYLHPVAPDADVPEPHVVQLAWLACNECAHAWQPAFDQSLLENIYRSHYWTPAPDGLAVQFRTDFLQALRKFGLTGPRKVVLEIGASAGDVLVEVQRASGASRAYAFEPNTENAVVARGRGLDVREKFFGANVARDGLETVDLIYSRHVIEHIFDFDDFFAGVKAVAAPTAHLVLETPCLDFHARHGTIDPFHIEHVHVFSMRSLVQLAFSHGWSLIDSEVTASGHMIAAFAAGTSAPQVRTPDLAGLQESVRRRAELLRHRLRDRYLIFWGAGSAGVGLATTLGREPDVWTDGNPNKVGKKFVGLTCHIIDPEVALAQGQRAAARDPVLVLASSFASEILPRVRQLGWTREVVDMEGRRLQ